MKVYIDMQVPFPYLTEDLIEQFQEEVDRRWEDLQFKCSR